jgi:hypothetical protein
MGGDLGQQWLCLGALWGKRNRIRECLGYDESDAITPVIFLSPRDFRRNPPAQARAVGAGETTKAWEGEAVEELGTYTNRRGMTFTLYLDPAQAPEAADYRAFHVLARNPDLGQRAFRIFVLKSHVPDREAAEMFVRGDPLKEVHQRLEFTDEAGTWMMWPDLSQGWAVL